MDIHILAKNLHPLERQVAPYLEEGIEFGELIKKTRLKDVEVMRALQWLSNKNILKIREQEKEVVELGQNGKVYKEKGLPERRFLDVIREKESKISEIIKKANLDPSEINVCIGTLKGKAAINIKKDKEMLISITDAGKNILSKETLEEKFLQKNFPFELKNLKEEERFALDNLKKRKDIVILGKIKIRNVELTEPGRQLIKSKIEQKEIIERLTPAILKNGAWKNEEFRGYDVSINVPQIYGGKRHFVNQAVDYIKEIWLELGFKEMTGNIVQTGFWDLDSLFVPQDHPARQMQDTFYIKNPAKGKLPTLWKKIREVHENGSDTGSRGWGGSWSKEIAEENLLRTHTTVLSAQTIAKLKETELPAKFFSVSKVFRNEAVDWKHLFELTQVEGIVVDPNSNFRHLIGYLKEFFKKMGYKEVRVRPGHFPYTEPSAEVDVYDPIRKQWIELGGSGIFRPEVTKPLLGFECPVLAWGLGMERTIAEYWNIQDIRELYKNDLRQMREMKFWMR